MTVDGLPPRETRESNMELPCAGPADCQLQALVAATTPAGMGVRLRNRALRIGSYFRDHLGEVALRLTQVRARVLRAPRPGWPQEEDPVQAGVGQGLIREGDRVRVLSMSDIQETLDEKGRCDGLRFMKGMEQYCGQTFTVLRRVQSIFDERAWEMRRIRGTVLLKDVVCRGRYMGDREGCDRCCFFFWKEQWLRKV